MTSLASAIQELDCFSASVRLPHSSGGGFEIYSNLHALLGPPEPQDG